MSVKYDRRTVLQQLTLGATMAASGMSFWPTRRALAQGRQVTVPGQPLEDRYYIICLFNGGWDVLLSLDPRDPAIFTQQAANDTKITPGYDRLASQPRSNGVYLPNRLAIAGSDQRAGVGAYLGDLTLDRNLADICIVRGINMSTLAHTVGRVRARTGRPPSGTLPRGSSAASWLARHYAQDELAPNFALAEEVYNVDQPVNFDPTSAASVQDLVDTLTPTPVGGALDPSAYDAIDRLLDGAYPCAREGESSFMQTSAQARLSADQMLARNLGHRFDFLANTAEMDALRRHYGFSNSPAELSLPPARGALAARAITSGLARVVSLTITDGLDTHFSDIGFQDWPRDQGPNQVAGWNAIARIMDDLRATPIGDGSGDSYWDRTTIVAYSDFGRTAMLNASGGRDHWLTSAMFLAGADIQGGQVVGASSDVRMTPTFVNLRTGAPDVANGTTLRPAHVWQSLFYNAGFDMGVDPADLRVPPLMPVLRNA